MKPGRGDWVRDLSAGLLVELIEPSQPEFVDDWTRARMEYWFGTTVVGDLVEVQLVRYSGDTWVAYFVAGERNRALEAQDAVLFGELP